MALAGPLAFGSGAFVLLGALGRWPLVELAVEIYLLKSAFALRALGAAALAVVARALAAGDLAAARRWLCAAWSRATPRRCRRRCSPPPPSSRWPRTPPIR